MGTERRGVQHCFNKEQLHAICPVLLQKLSCTVDFSTAPTQCWKKMSAPTQETDTSHQVHNKCAHLQAIPWKYTELADWMKGSFTEEIQ